MSEGVVDTDVLLMVPTGEKPKASRKRARQVKAIGATTIGKRFVCGYTGRLLDKAIIVPGLDEAFCNIPCAFAYIERQIKDEELRTKIKIELCDRYEQVLDVVARAPERELLREVGGEQDYASWIGSLHFWDVLTEAKGCTVSEYIAFHRKSKSVKAPKKQAEKIVLEPGQYLIEVGTSPSSCKRVVAIDGAEPAAVEGEGKKAKQPLTAVRAARKVSSFVSTNKDAAYEVGFISNDNFMGFGVLGGSAPNPKQRNEITSQLTGKDTYGPAVLFVVRKTTLKR